MSTMYLGFVDNLLSFNENCLMGSDENFKGSHEIHPCVQNENPMKVTMRTLRVGFSFRTIQKGTERERWGFPPSIKHENP